MTIERVLTDKKQYLDLLLLADEQEDMLDRYLEPGEMYALRDGGRVKCVAVVLGLDKERCELKNIAVEPESQGKGYGRAMVAHLVELYGKKYSEMLVGTGDHPKTLGLYRGCGFAESHRVKNFFTDNYDHPIIEDGVLLRDMIYLKRKLR